MKDKNLRKMIDSDGKEYRFNSIAFRECLQQFAYEKGTSKGKVILDMAEEIGVSDSSIKQWQLPKYGGPSDMQKVRDVAEYLQVDYTDFLKAREKEKTDKMNEIQVNTYRVEGEQKHRVELINSIPEEHFRVYTEREAANDIFRSVSRIFYDMRNDMIDPFQVLNDFFSPNELYYTLWSHMLELPEDIYLQLEEFFESEISPMFDGDSGFDDVFNSHICDEFKIEKYGSQDISLDSYTIFSEFYPYLEKRILGGLRNIFKRYLPK